MKYFNVFSKKEFTHQGETKTRWLKVGDVKVTDNGGKFLNLYMQPNTDFVILPEVNDNDETPVIE